LLPMDGLVHSTDGKLQSATSVRTLGNLSMAKLALPVNYGKLVSREKYF